METIPDLLLKLKDYGQDHILEHYLGLNEEKRTTFLRNISGFNFRDLFQTYARIKSEDRVDLSSFSPPEVLRYQDLKGKKELELTYRASGETLLKEGKVACLLVAGGKATRLGLNAPKGFFEIGPVSKKSFFQLFSEKILAVSRRYNTNIPFLIMTNPEDSKSVREFFESKRFFGLYGSVFIFEQDLSPCLTEDGKLILKNDLELLTSPNGHGNSLKRLSETGILDELLDMGIELLFYFQVDNPLVRICDPLFLGYHKVEKADISLKVVRRENPEERSGVLVRRDGKTVIVEYMELDPKLVDLKDSQGNPIFWALNTAIHVFSLSFLKENESGISNLPYHVVRRKASLCGVSELSVLKFETFVFDSFEYARRICALEVLRDEEFSPCKELYGPSSAASSQNAMSNLFKRWIESCGGWVKEGVKVEISPLFALDFEEFKVKTEGRKFLIERDTYIEEVKDGEA